MMYLVFLSALYVYHGGNFWSFVKSVLGYSITDDATPTGHNREDAPTTSTATNTSPISKIATAGALDRGGGYASDGAVSDGAASDGAVSDGATQPLTRFIRTNSGGTFSSSYQQVPGEEQDEEGAGVNFRSISINDDGDVGGGKSEIFSSGGRAAPVGAPKKARSSATTTWYLSLKDREVLKRKTIMARLTPLAIVSSFVSDLDLVTDWVFVCYVLVDFPLYLRRAGMVFAIFGTIMWALSTTEFALLSRLRVVCKGNNPLTRLEHVGLGWQLLSNVVVEDLPQFIITIITRPNSIPGVLNLATSGFSLLSKVIHGLSSTRAPSLQTQFHMINADPAVSRNLFRLRDQAKKQAKKAEHLVYLTWTYRCSKGQARAAAVFQVLQTDPTFVDGDLNYMRSDLFQGSRMCITGGLLTGCIPTQVGSYKTLRVLSLNDNNLTGTIPNELGGLRLLKDLDLSNNQLTGAVPVELADLTELEVLCLSGNALTGSVPAQLGELSMLTKIFLSNNQLSGVIPAELGRLNAVRELDLSHNQLTGEIPVELRFLDQLESLNLGSNKLSGPIPMELGKMTRLMSLVVANNKLSDVEEAEEELRAILHPECNMEFTPQEVEEEEYEEEGEAADMV